MTDVQAGIKHILRGSMPSIGKNFSTTEVDVVLATVAETQNPL